MVEVSRTGDESGSHEVPEPSLECGMPNGLDIEMVGIDIPGMGLCASSRPLEQMRAAAIARR